jgi:hypothetical protein
MPDSIQSPSVTILAEIEAVVRLYLDGLYEGDAEKLARAFHPVSALHSLASDGSVQVLPRDTWLDWVKSRPSPAALGLAREDRILAIDLNGEEAACVKLACAIPPRFFTDYLLLLKTGEGWRIVQKLFRTEIRA